MTLDPALLAAIGDIFLNLSAGWFGAAIIIPGSYPRSKQQNFLFVAMNLAFGVTALAIGYQLRILGV
jgi:hypothetical protein